MFSIEICANENVAILNKWLDHFKQTKMPAGLVLHEKKYSVWRAGQRSGFADKFDTPQGVLIEFVHGFDKIWRTTAHA